jgi:hypothetical protein
LYRAIVQDKFFCSDVAQSQQRGRIHEHHGVDIDSTSALWRRLCLAPLGHGAKNEAVRVARQTSTICRQSNGQIATLDRGDFMLLRVAVLSLGFAMLALIGLCDRYSQETASRNNGVAWGFSKMAEKE